MEDKVNNGNVRENRNCRKNREIGRYLKLLKITIARQYENWTPLWCDTNKDDLINYEMRRETVEWLRQLNYKLCYTHETFFFAISLLDKFLYLVKAQAKYLRCIATTCFYIAEKTLEEAQYTLTAKALIKESECGCSESEICRMEMCILTKIDWEINVSTPLTFLHLLFSLLLTKCPSAFSIDYLPSDKCLENIVELLERSLLHEELLNFPHSTLALAALVLQMKLIWQHWKSMAFCFQEILQVPEKDVADCVQLMEGLMSDLIINCIRKPLKVGNMPLVDNFNQCFYNILSSQMNETILEQFYSLAFKQNLDNDNFDFICSLNSLNQSELKNKNQTSNVLKLISNKSSDICNMDEPYPIENNSFNKLTSVFQSGLKRKVCEHSDTDDNTDDDFYEGMIRLYSDDSINQEASKVNFIGNDTIDNSNKNQVLLDGKVVPLVVVKSNKKKNRSKKRKISKSCNVDAFDDNHPSVNILNSNFNKSNIKKVFIDKTISKNNGIGIVSDKKRSKHSVRSKRMLMMLNSKNNGNNDEDINILKNKIEHKENNTNNKLIKADKNNTISGKHVIISSCASQVSKIEGISLGFAKQGRAN